MNVTIVGTGYVGLVSGVCLAEIGHSVMCVDIKESIVESINKGEPTIYENGLPELLGKVLSERRFLATTNLRSALDTTNLVIIAVGTPSEGGVIDLKFINNVVQDIGLYIRDHNRFLSVIVKSTVVPGTTDTFIKEKIKKISGKRFGDFGLGMNPEFLREGEAIEDFLEPDRIILGYEDERTLALLEELYEPWDVAKLRVNTRTAEMIKYANNALLATQISAINEIANLSAAIGNIDTYNVMQGIHLDKRWNPIVNGTRVSPKILTYLVPGCGFGGSCFPKDVQALKSLGEQKGLPMHFLNAVLEVNDNQPKEVINILNRETNNLAGSKILVLGLAFKPGTDDVRESASLKIITSLLQFNTKITAHDPIAIENFQKSLSKDEINKIKFVTDWEFEVSASDIIIVATAWPEYVSLISLNLKNKLLFDARQMFKPSNVGGARYLTIGGSKIGE